MHHALLAALAFVVVGCSSKETEMVDFDDSFFEVSVDEAETDSVDVWEKYYTMPLDAVLDTLSRIRYLPVNGYGWMGSPIEKWGCHIRMNALCNNEMLASLSRTHPAPIARAMAFDILKERRYDGCFQLLKDCLHDTATIEWGDDIVTEESVASFMVTMMEIVDDEGDYDLFMMTPEQQQELDSLLIFSKNMGHIERLKRILDTLPPEQKYYSRVRAIYVDEGIAEGLPALARFHNEQDYELVEEALSHYSDEGDSYEITCVGLQAVANWPDKRFWPMLKKIRRFVVHKHYTEADYSDLMRGCVNAAYHYFSPKAIRYIRIFNLLTFGNMYVKQEYCFIYNAGNDIPECYKKLYNKWDK